MDEHQHGHTNKEDKEQYGHPAATNHQTYSLGLQNVAAEQQVLCCVPVPRGAALHLMETQSPSGEDTKGTLFFFFEFGTRSRGGRTATPERVGENAYLELLTGQASLLDGNFTEGSLKWGRWERVNSWWKGICSIGCVAGLWSQQGEGNPRKVNTCYRRCITGAETQASPGIYKQEANLFQ